ncbi:unnamed protein product [Cladocopium goreaui]|uniref:BTB domain-containing protein n=1 Tax=Cladocopium goreaui TaxID=2562237 RepID=A0A9P1FE35_9DINO|nr:unnamed protein product [Cladocopium goreaui]
MESLAPLEPSPESRFDTVETVEPPLPQMSALQLAVDESEPLLPRLPGPRKLLPSPSAQRPCGGEGLRRDLLAFYDRHDDALADLIIHINEGAVVANMALVEARLPALLSSAEALGEADPALLVDDRGRRGAGPGLHQVRLSGVSRATLVQLLRWAYGEAVPAVGAVAERGGEEADAISLSVAFDLLEACSKFEVERLEALLRETLLESLDLPKFASVLRESHVRQIPGLKQGCMRFALHNFAPRHGFSSVRPSNRKANMLRRTGRLLEVLTSDDQLVDHPELFMKELSELPEVVSDLFRLGRVWKDAEEPGGLAAARPAPAVPSTLVNDLSRLFDVARQEEREDDAHGTTRSPCDLAPDCRVVVGEEMFLAHSVILSARSDFFKAAFSSDMVERNSLMVTLQHYRGDRPGRDAMLAILYFLYTGKTSKVTGSIAMDVLCLLGAEGDGDAVGGFLQLHDAATLRRACEAAAEHAAGEDEDGFIHLLLQAHELGALRLKTWAIRMAVHHFKELALRGALEVLPSTLLTEVLREVAVGYDRLLPSAAKGMRWELSLLPKAEKCLENTYEALTSPDLSCGAGACGTAGCSEASLVASFETPVRVHRIRVGVDLTKASAGSTGGSR